MMNGYLIEQNQIKKAFSVVDLNTAAVVGNRVDASKAHAFAVVVELGASVGATVELTLKQHTLAVGGTSKVLPVVGAYYYKKDADAAFTKVELAAETSLFDLSTLFAADAGIVVLEIKASDLDVNNGFAFLSVDVADSAAAKLASGLVVAHAMKYCPAYKEII